MYLTVCYDQERNTWLAHRGDEMPDVEDKDLVRLLNQRLFAEFIAVLPGASKFDAPMLLFEQKDVT